MCIACKAGMHKYSSYQKEGVDSDIKVQGRKGIARIRIVPHTDLEGHNYGRVEEKKTADKEHNCNFFQNSKSNTRYHASASNIIIAKLRMRSE